MEIDRLLDVYRRDGFASPLRVLEPNEARELADRLLKLVDRYQADPRFAEWMYFKGNLVLRWIADLAAHPGVRRTVEQVLGPDFLLWGTFVPVKPPRSAGRFGWHQDAAYWYLEPMDGVTTLWVALGPVNADNGGVRLIPGSHRLKQILPHEVTRDSTSMLRRGQRITVPVHESDAVALTLEPGEASLHTPFTVHGSSGNQSDEWRLGIGLNFVAANVVPLRGYHESAMPVQGKYRPDGPMHIDPVPEEDLHPAALDAYEVALKRATARYADVPDGTWGMR